jgi:putative SOS response-associated peptidase YedK
MQETFANADAIPSQRVPLLRVIRDSGDAKELVEARWGLIPGWSNGEPAKDRSGRPLTTFNAKIETFRTSATYRDAWSRGQRCLVPVRGFYEWQAQPPDWQRTVRHYITVNDQELSCFAGLWDRSIKAEGTIVESVTIITMPANELMKQIHNSRKRERRRELLPEDERRMPAILRKEDQETWLTGTAEEAWSVLKQYASGHMVAWPVDGPVDPTQQSLLQ